MNREEFIRSQNIPTEYYMVIADVKGSKTVLKTRNGRKEFQMLMDETRDMLDKYISVVWFEDTGVRFKLIRKGDCIGFVIDLSKGEIEDILREWKHILKNSNLRFHRNNCNIPSNNEKGIPCIDKYMEYLIYLEKDSKEASINKEDIYPKNKSLKVLIDLDVEDFIEENYIKTEIEYMINNYDWNVKSIEVKKDYDTMSKEEAHEAREVLFKFATINEKFDLIEGRKLNKKLGKFIDNDTIGEKKWKK